MARFRARSTDGLTTTTTITQTSDPFSRTIAALGVWTNTLSPGSVGAGPVRLTGLQGQGVHKASTMTAPLQAFFGFVKPIRKPHTAYTGYKGLGQGLPSTGSSASIGALLSVKPMSTANFLNGYGGE